MLAQQLCMQVAAVCVTTPAETADDWVCAESGSMCYAVLSACCQSRAAKFKLVQIDGHSLTSLFAVLCQSGIDLAGVIVCIYGAVVLPYTDHISWNKRPNAQVKGQLGHKALHDMVNQSFTTSLQPTVTFLSILSQDMVLYNTTCLLYSSFLFCHKLALFL